MKPHGLVAQPRALPCARRYGYHRAAEAVKDMGFRVILPMSAFFIAINAFPVAAGDCCGGYRHHDRHWHEVHRGIYERENRIALLQANPNIDHDDKGPVMTGARTEIRRLSATLRPPEWRWAAPCCYRRKPIHVR
jgi:hypothetical protein